MRQKRAWLILAVVIAFSAFPSALGAESGLPTPPEWIRAKDYVIFEESRVYEPEYWQCVLQLRADALAGNPRPGEKNALWSAFSKLSGLAAPSAMDPGAVYEMDLIELMYHKNKGWGDYFWKVDNGMAFILREWGDTLDEETKTKLELWSARWTFQMEYYGRTEKQGTKQGFPDRVPSFVEQIEQVMEHSGMTSFEEFLDCGTMETKRGLRTYQWMSAAGRADGRIAIEVDGETLRMDVAPEVRNQRTMVPLRAVAEALGADVEWIPESEQILLKRAGTRVVMTLNSTDALVNEEKAEMDVAPYATEGRTMLPARYVAEFLGQRVEWNGRKQLVIIEEEKSVAGGSNLEAWALSMGAMLTRVNGGDPARFGLYQRSADRAGTCRRVLGSNAWNISNRDTLIYTLLSMTTEEHGSAFREMAEDARLRAEGGTAVSEASGSWPSYMWEYTAYLDEKWGPRGLLAWDLFRISNLVQWGYTAGYISYEEALTLLEPAAVKLSESFSSWDEAYENYLDGYHWWERSDARGQDIWQTERGKLYQGMKADPKLDGLFDDSLFETGVIPLPEKP